MLFKEKKLKFIVLVVISGTVNFKQGLHGVAGTPVCDISASRPGNSGES